MTVHTKGPWEIVGNNVFAYARGIVATVPMPENGGVMDCQENLRLIAAAPDLLDALSALLQQSAPLLLGNTPIEFMDDIAAIRGARAAIAKATQL